MSAATEAESDRRSASVEWVTVWLIAGCYSLWGLTVFWVSGFAPGLAVLVAAFTIAFHSSLTHEVLHGHPFRSVFWSEMTMRLPLNLVIPYCRFRDLHLAHHRDSLLTDPYDDPETNYLDPAVWHKLPVWARGMLAANNTLAGRILIGPAIGQTLFFRDEWRRIWKGERQVLAAWALHSLGAAVVAGLVLWSPMPFWSYLVSVYLALGVLRIRTFLEHRAHESVRGRTVIIEDRGPLAFLFLNNNLHVVHHMYPGVPWYKLPALYRKAKDRFTTVNHGYVYRSYGEVFRRYFLRAKDPVAHPGWRRR